MQKKTKTDSNTRNVTNKMLQNIATCDVLTVKKKWIDNSVGSAVMYNWRHRTCSKLVLYYNVCP